MICIASAGAALWGCQASVQGDAKSSGDAHLEGDVRGNEENRAFAAFEAEESSRKPAPDNAVVPALDAPSSEGSTLLGARHDVFLRKGQSSQQCECLAVGVGASGDSQFAWNSAIPALDPATQIVVAFSAQEQACPGAPSENLGASYRGFVQEGPDVIVMVEAAVPGRPKVNGAIVPRPAAGGQLLLEPYPESLPFGKPQGGAAGRCAVALTSAPENLGAERAMSATSQRSEPSVEVLDDPNQVSDDADVREERRGGFYFGVFTGLGYALLDDDTLAGNASGLAIDVDILIGGSPVKDLAMGVILGGAMVPSPSGEIAGQSHDFDGVTLSFPRFGAFIDYYVMPDKNLHVLVEMGYQGATFSGSQAPLTNAGGGLGLAGGVGYDFWIGQRWSLGVLGRFTYAHLLGSNGSGTLLMPALLGTLAFH